MGKSASKGTSNGTSKGTHGLEQGARRKSKGKAQGAWTTESLSGPSVLPSPLVLLLFFSSRPSPLDLLLSFSFSFSSRPSPLVQSPSRTEFSKGLEEPAQAAGARPEDGGAVLASARAPRRQRSRRAASAREEPGGRAA